jgi:3-mercaptopyruvate sulfurtransferase SseA
MKKLNKKVKFLVCNFPGIKELSTYLLLLVFMSQLLVAQSEKMNGGKNGNLVSYLWLEKNLNEPDIILLDASPRHVFNEKHIAGAIDANSYMWFGISEIPKNEIEDIFRSWGISSDKKIVIYDEGGSIMAARLFYSLYYYGFPAENLFILDGGLYKWEETGLQVTNKVTEKPNNGTFKIREVNEEIRARLPEALAASGDTENNTLIEALEPGWHYGQVQMFSRAGHIPNSVLMPGADFYNIDKTFKSKEEIAKMLNYLNVEPQKQIYSYCGGGVAASVPFFVLKFIMKYPSVKLFVESELGWLQDERGLPYWTYDAPYLMRESNWLQSWGGKMLRMYFDPQISVVDIRTAEEFHKGHLQYSVNIPYELLKEALNHPDKIRKILDASGVKNDDEVVIVSGKGLTKESALALSAIMSTGQKNVSIFIDSMDKWTQLGFTLIKDSLSTEKQPTENESIETLNSYVNTSQNDVFLRDINDGANMHPGVFIASGETVPANLAKYKVIHLPYENFLNEDGTPKEAKEIWAMIDKAEVPRYTDLICFAEEPGEAAVNYFILKLMGYPVVKVWLN